MTPYDRYLFVRALGFIGLATAVAFVVQVATDEAQSTWLMRAARLGAFAPGIAAVGVAAATTLARSKGEAAALAAIGMRPARAALGAIVGGWLVGVMAAALLMTDWADVRALLPALAPAAEWVREGSWFVEASRGVRVDISGTLAWSEPSTAIERSVPQASRWAALWVIAPLALFAPPWAAMELAAAARFIGAALSIGTAIVVLHAVAAGALPAGLGAVASVWLAAQLVYDVAKGLKKGAGRVHSAAPSDESVA